MKRFLARASRHVGFQAGAVLLALFVGTALVSLFWTPHAVDALQMRAKLMPSSAAYPLGKEIQDNFGDWAKVSNPFFDGGVGGWSDILGLIPFIILAVILYLVGREIWLRGRGGNDAEAADATQVRESDL